MSDRRVVLGIGNTLNRDEGFGVHAARALQSLVGDKEGVEFIEKPFSPNLLLARVRMAINAPLERVESPPAAGPTVRRVA